MVLCLKIDYDQQVYSDIHHKAETRFALELKEVYVLLLIYIEQQVSYNWWILCHQCHMHQLICRKNFHDRLCCRNYQCWKLNKAKHNQHTMMIKKESYLTAPIDMTDQFLLLFEFLHLKSQSLIISNSKIDLDAVVISISIESQWHSHY